MDPLSLAVGAGIAATAFLIGRFGRGRAAPRAPRPVEPPEPTCSCGHSLAYHDREKQECHATVQTPIEFDKVYGAVDFEMRPCGCRRYVGPLPLESLYAPEITE